MSAGRTSSWSPRQKVSHRWRGFFVGGILIASWVLLSPWTNRDTDVFVAISVFLVVIPYVFSVLVLLLPALDIHKKIHDLKSETLHDLASQRIQLRRSIEQIDAEDPGNGAERDLLADRYNWVRGRILRIAPTVTYPYRFGQVARFVTTLTVPAIIFLYDNRESVADIVANSP